MQFFSRISETIATLWRESTEDIDSVDLLDDVDGGQERLGRQGRGDGRYCRLLSTEAGETADHSSIVAAWKQLEQRMALTPAGDVPLTVCYPVATQSGFDFAADSSAPVPVEAFYIDRFAVTNAEYAEFVNDGGYNSVELWPSEILAQVLQFVDQTGQSGPRGWSHGRPPEGKADHPVVGVCWYEAKAYARWAGKRLPSPAQWQQAGCWRTNESGHGKMLRYPWGNAFDPVKANIWSSGHRGTVPVDAYRQGCTPNGIYQLVGNVWEWVDADFEIRAGSEGIRVAMEQPMAEIRGGAFDTYFDAQATCQFRSGQIALHRTANVGFRCCVAVELLRVPPDPSAFLQEDVP